MKIRPTELALAGNQSGPLKAIGAVLREAGFDPLHLGGNPTNVAKGIRVVVVAPRSVSDTGLNVIKLWALGTDHRVLEAETKSQAVRVLKASGVKADTSARDDHTKWLEGHAAYAGVIILALGLLDTGGSLDAQAIQRILHQQGWRTKRGKSLNPGTIKQTLGVMEARGAVTRVGNAWKLPVAPTAEAELHLDAGSVSPVPKTTKRNRKTGLLPWAKAGAQRRKPARHRVAAILALVAEPGLPVTGLGISRTTATALKRSVRETLGLPNMRWRKNITKAVRDRHVRLVLTPCEVKLVLAAPSDWEEILLRSTLDERGRIVSVTGVPSLTTTAAVPPVVAAPDPGGNRTSLHTQLLDLLPQRDGEWLGLSHELATVTGLPARGIGQFFKQWQDDPPPEFTVRCLDRMYQNRGALWLVEKRVTAVAAPAPAPPEPLKEPAPAPMPTLTWAPDLDFASLVPVTEVHHREITLTADTLLALLRRLGHPIPEGTIIKAQDPQGRPATQWEDRLVIAWTERVESTPR